jgi:hypothetical protein
MWIATLAVMALATAGAEQSAVRNGLEIRFADKVVPTAGTRLALDSAYGRLNSPPLDSLEFVLSDVGFQMKRRFTEYSGDISGRMLGALQAAGSLVESESSLADRLAAALPKYQKADGHFGADQDLAAGVNQTRDMPILWGNGRLLLALCERQKIRPNPKLLEVARKIGDYAISTRPYYGKRENFERVGGAYASGFTTCYPSLIDGLAALAEVTGDARYAEEGRFIARLSLLDRAFEKHHSHGRFTAYRGMLDLDRLAGKPEFLDTIVADCRTVRERFSLPTGGVTETFDRTDIRDEGCTESDWIRVNLFLWRATGDPMYLDVAADVLRNHLLAVQWLNGGVGHRIFRVLRDGQTAWPGGGIDASGADAYWCCCMHATQVLADVARWGVVVIDNKPAVTWMASGRWTFKLDGREVTVSAQRRGPTTWKVRAESPQPLNVVLRLRVPEWCKELSVDGKPQTAVDGWANVPCRGETVSMDVTFPKEIRRAGVYASDVKPGEPVRLFLGGDLMCLPDALVEEGLIAADRVPTVRIASDTVEGNHIPVIVESAARAKKSLTRLVPMCRRPVGGCLYLFKVKQADESEFKQMGEPFQQNGVPVEFVLACDGHSEIYLNGRLMAKQSSLGEGVVFSAHARPGSNELALRVRNDKSAGMMIGLIRTAGGIMSVSSDKLKTEMCEDAALTKYLSDPSVSLGEFVAMKVVGELGIPPHLYMPGDYLATGARWVWPDTTGKDRKTWYLVRWQFQMGR